MNYLRGAIAKGECWIVVQGDEGEEMVGYGIFNHSFYGHGFILAKGGAAYKNYGMGRSRGTLPFQLAGNQWRKLGSLDGERVSQWHSAGQKQTR